MARSPKRSKSPGGQSRQAVYKKNLSKVLEQLIPLVLARKEVTKAIHDYVTACTGGDPSPIIDLWKQIVKDGEDSPIEPYILDAWRAGLHHVETSDYVQVPAAKLLIDMLAYSDCEKNVKKEKEIKDNAKKFAQRQKSNRQSSQSGEFQGTLGVKTQGKVTDTARTIKAPSSTARPTSGTPKASGQQTPSPSTNTLTSTAPTANALVGAPAPGPATAAPAQLSTPIANTVTNALATPATTGGSLTAAPGATGDLVGTSTPVTGETPTTTVGTESIIGSNAATGEAAPTPTTPPSIPITDSQAGAPAESAVASPTELAAPAAAELSLTQTILMGNETGHNSNITLEIDVFTGEITASSTGLVTEIGQGDIGSVDATSTETLGSAGDITSSNIVAGIQSGDASAVLGVQGVAAAAGGQGRRHRRSLLHRPGDPGAR